MSGERDFRPPFTSEYGEPGPSRWQRAQLWFSRNVLGEQAPQPTSGYLTLVPLNDRRLQPRRTALLVTCLLLFTASITAATYLLVPRGVSVGDIVLHSDRMSWNVSSGSYQLKLTAHIPVNNYNYLNAQVEGSLQVLFYTSEAGRQEVEPVTVPARSAPFILQVDVDASNVPAEYAISILSQCMSFPRQLIFFLRGSLSAKLPTTQQSIIAPLDLYWLISCDGEASIFPSHADWQNGTSSGIANALQSMAAAGSQQPLVLPDIRLGTSSIGGSKLAHL